MSSFLKIWIVCHILQRFYGSLYLDDRRCELGWFLLRQSHFILCWSTCVWTLYCPYFMLWRFILLLLLLSQRFKVLEYSKVWQPLKQKLPCRPWLPKQLFILEMERYMICMYRYIASLVSWHNNVLHNTVQCLLVSFSRWTYIALNLFSKTI